MKEKTKTILSELSRLMIGNNFKIVRSLNSSNDIVISVYLGDGVSEDIYFSDTISFDSINSEAYTI